MVDSKPRMLFVCLGVAWLGGCSVAPAGRIEDCRQIARNLRSENARLKDVTLSLKTENEDLIQRASDDARRIARLEADGEDLEKRVAAFAEERRALEAAFERVKEAAQETTIRR